MKTTPRKIHSKVRSKVRKRSKRNSSIVTTSRRRGAADVRGTTTRRTTIILNDTLERNLALLCAKEGISRSDYIARLIGQDLVQQGLRPDLPPKRLAVSY